jgi:predicted RNA-binding Zn-ribbon protein involved in translation (DUF1610 family)
MTLYFLISLLILSAFLGLIKLPVVKGYIGEVVVNLATKLFLNKAEYTLIKNIIIPSTDGTTQIDHIIVSKYGIFVVETKNMKGWIYGGQFQKTWTQKLYRWTYQFQNPLHQNYKHIKALINLLPIEQSKFFSVVVFIGNSKFKTPQPENVTHGIGYIKYIKAKRKTEILNKNEIQQIIEILHRDEYRSNLKNYAQHVKQVKLIKKHKIQKNKKNQKWLCPECNNPMVLRTAKKGKYAGNQFWGCSQYPQCKGIRQDKV